jgi:hypothetical protein
MVWRCVEWVSVRHAVEIPLLDTMGSVHDAVLMYETLTG